jgi:hypothetical protein
VSSGRRDYASKLSDGPIHQSRDGVIRALRALGPHEFSKNVDFDLCYLGEDDGILVICHGKVEGSDGVLNVESHWLLRKKEIVVDDKCV